MQHSTYDSSKNQKHKNSEDIPIRSKPDQRVDFSDEHVEDDHNDRDETDPYDNSVCGHVSIVIFEMCQNGLFDVFGMSEVRNDEGGSVVYQKCWQGERPERGEPSCGESGEGEEQTVGSLHAVDHAENGRSGGSFLSSIEIILFGKVFFSIDFLFVKDFH